MVDQPAVKKQLRGNTTKCQQCTGYKYSLSSLRQNLEGIIKKPLWDRAKTKMEEHNPESNTMNYLRKKSLLETIKGKTNFHLKKLIQKFFQPLTHLPGGVDSWLPYSQHFTDHLLLVTIRHRTLS